MACDDAANRQHINLPAKCGIQEDFVAPPKGNAAQHFPISRDVWNAYQQRCHRRQLDVMMRRPTHGPDEGGGF
jgi:hypothetical protein